MPRHVGMASPAVRGNRSDPPVVSAIHDMTAILASCRRPRSRSDRRRHVAALSGASLGPVCRSNRSSNSRDNSKNYGRSFAFRACPSLSLKPIASAGLDISRALCGLGDLRGNKIVWHYGHAFESSSLLAKISEDHVTFVILANSDRLSRWRGLGDSADITASPAATSFLHWYFGRKDEGGSAPRQRS